MVCLKQQLRAREERVAAQRDHPQQIHDLVRQMQDHKYLSSLRDSIGGRHTNLKKVVSLLKDYWSGVIYGVGGMGGARKTATAYRCG